MRELCNTLRGMFVEAKRLNPELQEMFDRMCVWLQRVEGRIKNGSREIAFTGRTNVGKSTLLNTLFGAPVAPSRNGPYTAAVVEYRYANRFTVTFMAEDKELGETMEFDTPEELTGIIERNATVSDESTRAKTTRMVVKLPSELLASGLVVYDTPGFGATRGEQEDAPEGGIHDDIVVDFLAQHDCEQLFWVFRGTALQDNEKEFVKRYADNFLSRNRLIVNVTCDNSPKFQQRYRAEYGNVLSKFGDDVLFVNAKNEAEADTLINWVKGRLGNGNESRLANLATMLRRFSSTCSEIRRRRVVWPRTSFARATAALKRFGMADEIEMLKQLGGRHLR